MPSRAIQEEASVYGSEKFVHCGTFNDIHDCIIKIESRKQERQFDHSSKWELAERVYVYVAEKWIEKSLNDGVISVSAQSFDWGDGDVFYFWKSGAVLQFEATIRTILNFQVAS